MENILYDSCFYGAQVLNVWTKKWEKKDIYILRGKIAALLPPKNKVPAKETFDCNGKKIVPSFIDAHVHIESSSVQPKIFAQSVCACGTACVIADCHELANVIGPKSIPLMAELSKDTPCDIYFMIPSCVPATDFDHAGGTITADDIKELCQDRNLSDKILGLGEMMNYPGVLQNDKNVFNKIQAIKKELGAAAIIDGHAPLLSGCDLQRYAGAGISTDHECSSIEEVIERIENGMYVLLRQGSAARDLENIVPALVESGLPLNRVCFCTDDKKVGDIIKEGHINSNIKNAISCGMNPIDAFCCASINSAECYRLNERGAICPGRLADFVILNNENTVEIDSVVKSGKIFSSLRDAQAKPFELSRDNKYYEAFDRALHSVHLETKDVSPSMFETFSPGAEKFAIGIIPGSLNTKKVSLEEYKITDTKNLPQDCCLLSVIERHKNTGFHSLCLLSGYGLEQGAIAMSIGHDSHNIIVAGKNSGDMARAVQQVCLMQGGIAISLKEEILSSLSLPFAGLMSLESAEEVGQKHRALHQSVKSLGIPDNIAPFVALSFLALPVIPSIRLTDSGLFDVEKWQFLK